MLAKQNVIEKKFRKDTVFVQFIKQFFRLIGKNVAARPYFTIFTCLFITALCSSSLALTEMTNDITDFTPRDSRALTELEIYNNFFGHKGDSITIFVFVTAKDGGSMLRVQNLNETVQLHDLIANDVKIVNEKRNKTLFFSHFCTSFCEANEPVRNVYNGLLINEQYNGTSDQIDLAYPISTILGQKFRIDDNFYGVEIGKHNALLDARMILLQFRAVLQDYDDKNAERYELEVTNFIQNNFKSDMIDVVSMSSSFITAEIVRAGLSLLPFTVIGFIIMCIFSAVTTSITAILASQFHYYKLLIAISACISPVLASATALGFLLWCGLRFGSILTSTPILVLAIGVDDAFLMINYWHQIYQREMITKEMYSRNKMERLNDRMCDVLQQVGPSISITTLTNVLAFGVGAVTSVPEIQVFCIGNAVAMMIAFIYQITLFAAVMIVLEYRGEEDEKPVYRIDQLKYKISDDLNSAFKNLLDKYCSTLCTTSFSLITIIGLLLYWTISIYGAITINVELKPEHLIKKDSDIVKVLQLRDEYIMPYNAPALIFVDRPGNLNDPKNVHILNQIVIDFEVLPTSVGKSGTEFWLRDYYDFIDSLERNSLDGLSDSNPDNEMNKNSNRNSTAISIKQYDLKNFLDWPEFRHWTGFLQFNFDEYGVEYLKSYFFKISSRADLRKWSNRAKLLNQLRNVADRYPEHEVYVFDDDAKFLDIIGTLLYQTIQSSFFTVIFMMFICFLFIPSYAAVLITTFSIISIFIGVFGMLSIWDVDLDPVVMSALIMSIGFSVDIPAHIIYHFFAAGQDTVEASLQHCLGTIGFPVLQAAISTILCLSSIQFSCLRMGHVFVKTMVLVVTIGFIHGVIIIPVLYSILSRIRLPGRKRIFKINTVTTPKTVTSSPENLTVTLAIDAELKISIQ